MAQRGWTFNTAEDRWELLGGAGEQLAAVTPEFLARLSGAQLGRYWARRGWPPLSPAAGPWWRCVLTDGPFAGQSEYLDPGVYADAPALLLPAGTRCVYRRLAQACGHGRLCGIPYSSRAAG